MRPGIALLCLSALAVAACVPPAVRLDYRVVDRPIKFSQSRRAATRRYFKDHYGIDRMSIDIVPRVIVVHWTGLASADRSWAVFDPETLPASRRDISGGGSVNVSAHFLVDRDGTVFKLMPETRMARHVIGLNHCAIGIENAGGVGGRDDLTDEQLEADAILVRELKGRHPTIAYLIGHHEYRRFEGKRLWMELNPGYRTVKSDPGDPFMSRLRAMVADLGLKGPPQ